MPGQTPHLQGADNGLIDRCRKVVRGMMSEYEWQLLSEEHFIELVLDKTSGDASRTQLRTLALQTYTIVLYEACYQNTDALLQEQGYRELHRFLYRTALSKWPDESEDLAQLAILLVHEQIENCRNPNAFLKFALYKLRQAQTQLQRRLEKTRREQKEADQHQGLAGMRIPSPHQQTSRQEQQQTVLQAIERISDARKQNVIFLKYFEGLSDDEIATRLEITANHVRVLRNRGIAQLKSDMILRLYFQDEDF